MNPAKARPASAVQQQRWLQQLATLLRAGIALHPALALMNLQQPAAQQRYWQPVITGIEQGHSLASVLARQAGFRASDTQLIAIAERSGQLDVQLERLAIWQSRRLHLQQQVRSALRYPLMVLIGALAVTVFLLWRVVPGFADLYHSFGAELPWLTLKIMALSHLVQRAGLPCVLVLSLLLGGISRQWQISARFRRGIYAVLWRLPLIGAMTQAHWLGLWHRTLHETLRAGLPLLEALHETAVLVAESPLASAQPAIADAVAQGQRLSDSLATWPTYPALSTQMIAIGEESGMLVSLLDELARQFEAELENHCGLLLKLLEPTLMAGLGILVGTVVMALYLPLFELGNAI
ncbi:MAG: type II secretion system F family protein [Pseudomonadota bacterium]